MILTLSAATLAAQVDPVDGFRCPESYATDVEREAAVKVFVEAFAKQHPQATLDDLVTERVRLLAAHSCHQTLASIAAQEKVALQIVSPQTQSLMLAGRRFTRVDEYYDAATRVWSVIFIDDPHDPENYANQIILNFYDWKPKPTVDAVAMALSEEHSGTKNVSLFKAPDGAGGEIVYHIISITRGRANFVNVMTVTSCEISVVNITFSHRLGGGTDPHKNEMEARQWLLSADGEALRSAAALMRVGVGWREYLRQVK